MTVQDKIFNEVLQPIVALRLSFSFGDDIYGDVFCGVRD